jgi:hypothetical protein
MVAIIEKMKMKTIKLIGNKREQFCPLPTVFEDYHI